MHASFRGSWRVALLLAALLTLAGLAKTASPSRASSLPAGAQAATPGPCADSPKRMIPGEKALVCTWRSGDNVLLRERPERRAPKIKRIAPGAVVTITGEAVCDEATGWWYWPVRTRSGYTGWMPEGSDENDPYFLCPYP